MYRQVGSGNRSKGGLHAGQKEVEQTQRKQALLRRCSELCDGPRLSDTHRWSYRQPEQLGAASAEEIILNSSAVNKVQDA